MTLSLLVLQIFSRKKDYLIGDRNTFSIVTGALIYFSPPLHSPLPLPLPPPPPPPSAPPPLPPPPPPPLCSLSLAATAFNQGRKEPRKKSERRRRKKMVQRERRNNGATKEGRSNGGRGGDCTVSLHCGMECGFDFLNQHSDSF